MLKNWAYIRGIHVVRVLLVPALGPRGGIVFGANSNLGDPEALVAPDLLSFDLCTMNSL